MGFFKNKFKQKMKFTIILLVCLAAFAIADQYPPECNDYDCPNYTVLSTDEANSIQFRHYESARWIRTAVQGFFYEEAVHIGFMKLFHYISGENVDGISIPMTIPVTVQIIPGAGPFHPTTFIVSFYAPSEYQAPNPAPPAPTDSEIFIETLPATNKAVYMFPGIVISWHQIAGPISDLVNYLSSEGYQFIPNIETFAGYDSPVMLQNRHNEIWIDVYESK